MSILQDKLDSKAIAKIASIKLSGDLDPTFHEEVAGSGHHLWEAIKGLGRGIAHPFRNIHPGDAANALYETRNERALRGAVEDANSGFLGDLVAAKDKSEAYGHGLVDHLSLGDRAKSLAATAVDHPILAGLGATVALGGLGIGAKSLYDKFQEHQKSERAKAKAKDEARVLARARTLISEASKAS